MAAKKGGAKGGAAKKGPVKKKHQKLHTIYANGKAKNLTCPKCGPGIFLAAHKDRASCGKCGYMEKK